MQDLKTPSEWSIIDRVTLLEGTKRGHVEVKLKSKRKISQDKWTEMVLASEAFRFDK